MTNFNELIALEYENEYESAYDLSVKRNFSNPKIYSAGGDLTKRWYVYFSFRDPKSGKLKRLTPFYGNANKYKTKEDRMSVLVTYRKVLLRLLKQGYNPYTDNTELHQRLNAKKDDAGGQVSTMKENIKTDSDDDGPKMTVQEAFDFGLARKEKILSPTTKRGYENKIKNFLKWLKTNRPEIVNITDLDKKDVTSFLNDILYCSTFSNFKGFVGSFGR